MKFAWRFWAALATVAVVLTSVARLVSACPFCSAVSLTFCEEVAGADVAVIANLAELPSEKRTSALDSGKAKFEILDVLKGDKALSKGQKFEALYFGDNPVGTTFLVMGMEPPDISWSTPIVIGKNGQDYIAKALALPKEGAERLIFFQEYLEGNDEMLSRDAYDEFAKVPYSTVKDLKPHMHHDQLLAWIENPKVAPSRRRLYLTMLGVCGTPEDADRLEKMISSDDRQAKSSLDALIAAYLTLKGPEGMPLIEKLFLKNKDAEYTETYSAIMALRFHGQEETIIPRARLLEGLRYMLDRPQLADLIIPDLARWQDWSVMDRLVELFKTSDDESNWVRVPVINYLRACPLPKAKEYFDELAKLDPETVKKASSLFPLGAATAEKTEKSKNKSGEKDDSEKATSGKETEADGSASEAASAAKDSSEKEGAEESTDQSDAAADEANSAQADKPQADAQAIEDGSSEGTPATALLSAGTNEADAPVTGPNVVASTRLSRGVPPGVSRVAQVGALSVLGWLLLAGTILGLFLLALLRGGQQMT